MNNENSNIKSKFVPPENFTEFKYSKFPKSLKLYYGSNDWEDSINYISLYFLNDTVYKDFKRIWIKLKYPENIRFPKDENEAYKGLRKLFMAILKRLIRITNEIRNSTFFYSDTGKKIYKEWYDCFKLALNDSKLKKFIQEWGEDTIQWIKKDSSVLTEIFSGGIILEGSISSIVENPYFKLFKGYNYLKLIFSDGDFLFIPLNFHGYLSEEKKEKIRNIASRLLIRTAREQYQLKKENSDGGNNELQLWKDSFHSAITSKDFSKYILWSDPYPLMERMSFTDLENSAKNYERKHGSKITRSDRSKLVNVNKMEVKSFKQRNENFDAYVFEYQTKGSDNSWQGFLKFLMPRIPKEPVVPIKSKQSVVVNCTCPDYRYVWAVPNRKKGAGIIGKDKSIGFGNDNNGSNPSVRNPENIPGLCKHLIALKKYLNIKFKKYPVATPPGMKKNSRKHLIKEFLEYMVKNLDKFNIYY